MNLWLGEKGKGGGGGNMGEKGNKKEKKSDSLVISKLEEIERRLCSLLRGGRCCERRLVEEEI